MLQFRKNGYLYTITKLGDKYSVARMNENELRVDHLPTSKEALAHALVLRKA